MDQQPRCRWWSTLDENNEASVDVDFDVENTGTCDIYIRVAILPIILDKQNSQIVFSNLTNLLVIQYCNENDSSVLIDEYWKNHLMDITIIKSFKTGTKVWKMD